ncbi:MAG: hypothetical protein JO154_11420 [Chitinophaga sp.]|uniref:hypothetical protein n=1 Tax=Chitinophaga sp. TaxID=1869181 RepID=UPI0025BD1D75|nr:hypothetical protein [Chitinophaga sp.]MBV8253206.1 hypothetical protein [Chitinophaga sp.]
MVKSLEVVVNPSGFTNWAATKKKNQEKLLAFLRKKAEELEADPSHGLMDLVAAGIWDENADFTKPFNLLNECKAKQ